MMTREEIVKKYPRLSFIKSSRFLALPREKQEFYLECIEDASFWVELDKKASPDDGFKFLASSFGLERAQQEAKDRGLTGKEREEFLQPHQELYTTYNPYSGRTNDR
jgi:hypothetical protein